jgi:hypothetical protein
MHATLIPSPTTKELTMMDPEGRCTRCGDYARDCICPDPTEVEISTGCSVSVTLNPDGSLSVSFDFADVLDDPTYVWQGGEEVTDDYDEEILAPIAAALNAAAVTHTITIPAPTKEN